MPERFEKASTMPATAAEVFDWHCRPGAFTRLTPPWQRVEVVRTAGVVPRDGSRVELRVKLGPLWRRWLVEHEGFVDGERFVDRTLVGPFPGWRHVHEVAPIDPGAARLRDEITFDLPGGPLVPLGRGFAMRQIERSFRYRHAVTRADALTHRRAIGKRLTVAVSGSTGLIGSALVALLGGGGHRVIRLVRGEARGDDEARWSVAEGVFEHDKLEGVDAVVHLAAENIVGRWTDAKKRRIRDSRVDGTRLLAEGLAKLARKPGVLVSASAVGIYGDRGDAVLDESAEPGEGFLCDVAAAWEAAADPARAAGVRVVHPRLGMVLTPAGGAVKKMLPAFSLGLGGVLGPGTQAWPWITLDDAVDALHFVIFQKTVAGPVNFVGPEPVDNRAFTKTLGRVIGRPTVLPAPKLAAKLAFGELTGPLFFASADTRPRKLVDAGYAFRHPTLEAGLRHVLGREDDVREDEDGAA